MLLISVASLLLSLFLQVYFFHYILHCYHFPVLRIPLILSIGTLSALLLFTPPCFIALGSQCLVARHIVIIFIFIFSIFNRIAPPITPPCVIGPPCTYAIHIPVYILIVLSLYQVGVPLCFFNILNYNSWVPCILPCFSLFSSSPSKSSH